MNASYTYQEIAMQGESMEKTLRFMLATTIQPIGPSHHVVFTGCGTSYYLAIAAARFFQETTGIPSQAVPASELFIHTEQILSDRISYKIVSISRSGTTSEIVRVLKALKDCTNVSTLAMTCNKNTEMVQVADESIVLDHIQEKSVVMTQSFTNMFYALQLYATLIDKKETYLQDLKQLPHLMGERCKDTMSVQDIGESSLYHRFIFLGTGVSYGLAEEACLKMKEMTQTECEAYSSLEFRHGPISIVDAKTMVILLSTNKTRELDEGILHDIKSFGGTTLAIARTNFVESHKTVVFESPIADLVSPLLAMPYLQMLAYYRAVAFGLNPDKPRNLNQVVKITLPK